MNTKHAVKEIQRDTEEVTNALRKETKTLKDLQRELDEGFFEVVKSLHSAGNILKNNQGLTVGSILDDATKKLTAIKDGVERDDVKETLKNLIASLEKFPKSYLRNRDQHPTYVDTDEKRVDYFIQVAFPHITRTLSHLQRQVDYDFEERNKHIERVIDELRKLSKP